MIFDGGSVLSVKQYPLSHGSGRDSSPRGGAKTPPNPNLALFLKGKKGQLPPFGQEPLISIVHVVQIVVVAHVGGLATVAEIMAFVDDDKFVIAPVESRNIDIA